MPVSEEKMRETFALFDTNARGHLKAQEMLICLRSLGVFVSDEAFYTSIKGKEDAAFRVDDFLALAKPMVANANPKVALDKAFEEFDRDRDGTVNTLELIHVMKNLGATTSEDDLEELKKMGDPKGEGKIRYKELSQILCGDLL